MDRTKQPAADVADSRAGLVSRRRLMLCTAAGAVAAALSRVGDARAEEGPAGRCGWWCPSRRAD